MSNRRKEMGEEGWAEYQRDRKNSKAKKYKALNYEIDTFRAAEARRKRKKVLIEYAGGECEHCGFNEEISSCYDFHHKDPSKKEFAIGTKNYGLEKQKKEVDKCLLLCRNCHAKVHHKKHKEEIDKKRDKLFQCSP
tara:strand:- start:3098 stop:3505 length:408 start_codon:yes stop_codon:yes gene_type:complete